MKNNYFINLFLFINPFNFMKFKSLLWSLLAVAVAATSCSKDGAENTPNLNGEPEGYITINVKSNGATRSNSSNNGVDPDETYVRDAYAIFFNGDTDMASCVGFYSIPGMTGVAAPPTTFTDANAFKIATSATHMLVYVNPTPEMLALVSTGAQWRDIAGAAITFGASVSTPEEMAMASAGYVPSTTATDLATLRGKYTETGLVSIISNIQYVGVAPSTIPSGQTAAQWHNTIASAKAAAAAAKASVEVDRLTAKISVITTGVAVTSSLSTSDAEYTHTGFYTTGVNKKYFGFSKLATYTDASATTYTLGFLRIDPNYTGTMNVADFYYLSNDTEIAHITSIINATGAVVNWGPEGLHRYCPENTIAGDATSKRGYATAIIVKGTYTPDKTKYASGDDYWMYDGRFYTTAEFNTLYNDYKADHLAANASATSATAGGVWADANAFATLLVPPTSPATETEFSDTAVQTIITAASGTVGHDTAGLVARYGAVRFYPNGVNYYESWQRHDNEVVSINAPGKYGVVRNNWYTNTITKISGPGTPWIPGDYLDPTNPEDPEKLVDEEAAYIVVEVTINPWITWAHDVELGE